MAAGLIVLGMMAGIAVGVLLISYWWAHKDDIAVPYRTPKEQARVKLMVTAFTAMLGMGIVVCAGLFMGASPAFWEKWL